MLMKPLIDYLPWSVSTQRNLCSFYDPVGGTISWQTPPLCLIAVPADTFLSSIILNPSKQIKPVFLFVLQIEA